MIASIFPKRQGREPRITYYINIPIASNYQYFIHKLRNIVIVLDSILKSVILFDLFKMYFLNQIKSLRRDYHGFWTAGIFIGWIDDEESLRIKKIRLLQFYCPFSKFVCVCGCACVCLLTLMSTTRTVICLIEDKLE